MLPSQPQQNAFWRQRRPAEAQPRRRLPCWLPCSGPTACACALSGAFWGVACPLCICGLRRTAEQAPCPACVRQTPAQAQVCGPAHGLCQLFLAAQLVPDDFAVHSPLLLAYRLWRLTCDRRRDRWPRLLPQVSIPATCLLLRCNAGYHQVLLSGHSQHSRPRITRLFGSTSLAQLCFGLARG